MPIMYYSRFRFSLQRGEMLRSMVYFRYSLYCCKSGHVTLSKITLSSRHGVGVDIITRSRAKQERTHLLAFRQAVVNL